VSRLDTELRALFGRETWERSKQIDLQEFEAADYREVAKAAGELLRIKGKPQEQVQFVKALGETRALLLCRMVGDSGGSLHESF